MQEESSKARVAKLLKTTIIIICDFTGILL